MAQLRKILKIPWSTTETWTLLLPRSYCSVRMLTSVSRVIFDSMLMWSEPPLSSASRSVSLILSVLSFASSPTSPVSLVSWKITCV